MAREHQRPLLTSTDQFDWYVGGDDPETQHRLAHDTAWALLDRVRSQPDPELVRRVVEVTDGEGIHDVAELWAHTHPRSLSGLLWRLYLIRRVVTSNPDGATELFDIGLREARTIDPIIAGVADPVTPRSIRELCDTILRGAFVGDFADALDRAASTAQIISIGATSLAGDRDRHDDEHAATLTTQALRFDDLARDLRGGAVSWRAGTVQ